MKKKPMIIIGVTILILGGIAYFLILPTAQAALKGWRELDTSKAALAKAQEKNKTIESLKKNKEQLTSVANIAQTYIPKSGDSGELVIELTAIAQTNNLVVQETALDKGTAAPQAQATDETTTKTATPTPASSAAAASSSSGLQSINFSLKLAGKYSDFLNFLETIESSAKLISIKNFTLQTSESGLGVQLSGTAFFKPSVSLSSSLENIKITQDTINTFLNLKSHGAPITAAESGSGRSDPFAGY